MDHNKENELIFKPAWWLPGPHLQTLWPTLCRPRFHPIALKRERLELKDGDFIDLDWSNPGNAQYKNTIVLLLHGLEGSINSPYAKGMMFALERLGFRSVFMHFRGCSGDLNRHSRMYHSGETEDLREVIEMLQKREKCHRIGVIGFSLGGNVLMKFLGEGELNASLSAAVGISVPFELSKASFRVTQGFSRIYQQYFMRSLKKKVIKKFLTLPPPFELSIIKKLNSLRDFDDKVTAPLHGFLDADDYYNKSSCRQFLKNITVPTLLLNSKDDPLMTSDIFPEDNEMSSQIKLELTQSGGHVGFVSGEIPGKAEYWLEKRAPAFLKEYLTT